MVSTTILKDPMDPRWADDPQVKLFKEKAVRCTTRVVDLADPNIALGWTVAAVAYQT
jgi:hypothetical protein